MNEKQSINDDMMISMLGVLNHFGQHVFDIKSPQNSCRRKSDERHPCIGKYGVKRDGFSSDKFPNTVWFYL